MKWYIKDKNGYIDRHLTIKKSIYFIDSLSIFQWKPIYRCHSTFIYYAYIKKLNDNFIWDGCMCSCVPWIWRPFNRLLAVLPPGPKVRRHHFAGGSTICRCWSRYAHYFLRLTLPAHLTMVTITTQLFKLYLIWYSTF